MEQPRNESVTRINALGVQTLVEEDLTFGEALGKVWRLRRHMNHMIAVGDTTEHFRTYYRLGRPH